MEELKVTKKRSPSEKLGDDLSYLYIALILTFSTLIIQVLFVDEVSITVSLLLGLSFIFIVISGINGAIAEKYVGHHHPIYFADAIATFLIISTLFNVLAGGFLLYFGFYGGTGWYSVAAIAIAIFCSIKTSFSAFET